MTTNENADQPHHPPERPYVITVNSREETVPAAHVAFEQVVQLAYPGGHDSNVKFSMTFRHVASKPQAGELSAGGSVEVRHEGSTFNVTRTVQS